MIGLTVIEFNVLREAVAGSHLLIQATAEVLKQRRVALSREQRNLLDVVPACVAEAYETVAAVTRREQGKSYNDEEAPTVQLTDFDTLTFRNELENVSALNMPDLQYEMSVALTELPGLATHWESGGDGRKITAAIMAITWEAGRRYGIIQAGAVFDSTSNDYIEGTHKVFESTLDSTLELPTPELPMQHGRVAPLGYASANTAESGDTRSTDTAPLTIHEVEPKDTVN